MHLFLHVKENFITNSKPLKIWFGNVYTDLEAKINQPTKKQNLMYNHMSQKIERKTIQKSCESGYNQSRRRILGEIGPELAENGHLRQCMNEI